VVISPSLQLSHLEAKLTSSHLQAIASLINFQNHGAVTLPIHNAQMQCLLGICYL
jgi:hypothetical protein